MLRRHRSIEPPLNSEISILHRRAKQTPRRHLISDWQCRIWLTPIQLVHTPSLALRDEFRLARHAEEVDTPTLEEIFEIQGVRLAGAEHIEDGPPFALAESRLDHLDVLKLWGVFEELL